MELAKNWIENIEKGTELLMSLRCYYMYRVPIAHFLEQLGKEELIASLTDACKTWTQIQKARTFWQDYGICKAADPVLGGLPIILDIHHHIGKFLNRSDINFHVPTSIEICKNTAVSIVYEHHINTAHSLFSTALNLVSSNLETGVIVATTGLLAVKGIHDTRELVSSCFEIGVRVYKLSCER
ncbi:MAG: hypothetical protein K0R73_413 [Candidatus Midichloriaceae bacterium]|nr:hypothetical protein [Candidatus Midichloriaceae bacterium]